MTRKTGGRGEGGGEGGEEEEKTTHIKSNNPHLTDGEKRETGIKKAGRLCFLNISFCLL